MNKNKEQFGEFGYRQVEREAMKKGQFPTPLHVCELMTLLAIPEEQLKYNEKGEIDDSSYEWYKDRIVYEPCVGTGNFFWPLKNKGAILIGNDIDAPSLETCKQRIPEAILTNCDILTCVNPELIIKDGEKEMVKLDEELKQLLSKEEKTNEEKKRIKSIPSEIEKLTKVIKESKLRKPWKYGLYCSEHTFYEPEETIKRLETKLRKDHREFMNSAKKLQKELLQKERDEKNGGVPIWYDCHRCGKKVMDAKAKLDICFVRIALNKVEELGKMAG